MITRNYYALLATNAIVQGTAPTSLSVRTNGGGYNAAYKSGYKGSYLGFMPNAGIDSMNSADYDASSLIFGSNDEEETYNDYNINGLPLTFTVGIYNTPTYNNETKEYTITRRFVLTNNKTTEMTINEFGFVIGFYIGASSSRGALIYRKKLDTSFVVASGETVNFDLTVTYQMPVEFEPYVPE